MPTPTQCGQVPGLVGDFSRNSMHTKSSPAQGTEDKKVVHRLSPPFASAPPVFHLCGIGITMGSPLVERHKGKVHPICSSHSLDAEAEGMAQSESSEQTSPAPRMDGMSQRRSGLLRASGAGEKKMPQKGGGLRFWIKGVRE